VSREAKKETIRPPKTNPVFHHIFRGTGGFIGGGIDVAVEPSAYFFRLLKPEAFFCTRPFHSLPGGGLLHRLSA